MDFRAFFDGVSYKLFNRLAGFDRDERAEVHAVIKTIANFKRVRGCKELLNEGILHILMNEDAVRADAGLAGIAKFGRHDAFDRKVEVCVVKDDERRVAAKLHGEAL